MTFCNASFLFFFFFFFRREGVLVKTSRYALLEYTQLTLFIQYTIAPSLVGAVILVCFAYSSDYFGERGLHIAASVIVNLVGYILMQAVPTDETGVLYFAMFLCTAGVSIREMVDQASNRDLMLTFSN